VRKHNLPWLLLSVVIIIFDQMTKLMITHHLHYATGYRVTSFFNLLHARNYGAAFSFMDDPGGGQRWLFSSISLIVSVMLIVWLLTLAARQRWRATALTLIIGGALSNFWGRLTLGYVVDFLDFHIGQYHWPAFNIADMTICIGVIMLFVGFTNHKK